MEKVGEVTPQPQRRETQYTLFNDRLIQGVFAQLYQQVLTEIREAPQKRLSEFSQRVITEICNLDNDLNERPIALPLRTILNTTPRERLFTPSQRVNIGICNLGNDLVNASLPTEPKEKLSKLSQGVIAEICEAPQERLSKLSQRVITLLAKRVIAQLPQPKITEIRKSQEERTFELVRQIVSKICSFADGASLALGANGFKITKDILDVFSNAVRFIAHIIVTRRTLPKPDRSFKDYFYNIEKKEIVLGRLILAASSICKVILRFAPQLTRLQAVSKLFPYVSLALDALGLVLNYEKFTKDGFTKENVLKIVAALSYHAISCATFVIAGSSGGIIAYLLLAQLVEFFNRLAAGGMQDVALIVQPLDKLLLSNAIKDNVRSFVKSIWSDKNIADEDISRQGANYLSLIGLKMCYSAASEIIKIIREFINDSRKIPETNVAEAAPQEEEAPADTNENLLISNKNPIEYPEHESKAADVQMAQ